MFYSKSTGGFYSRAIHGDNIPADAVEITAESHQELLQGQSEGKLITADKNGYPIAVTPTVTPEQIKQQRIAELKRLLAESDYKETPSYMAGKTDEENTAIFNQRTAWRDEIRELEA